MWQEQNIGLLCNISSRTVSLTFLLHLDVFYDQLLNSRWTAWNLFVSYDKKKQEIMLMTPSMHLSCTVLKLIRSKNQPKRESNLTYIKVIKITESFNIVNLFKLYLHTVLFYIAPTYNDKTRCRIFCH